MSQSPGKRLDTNKPIHQQSYSNRASLPDAPALNSYLLRLMASKRTNLCLSADVKTTAELLDIAEECGDSICVLKTHADIVSDFGDKTMKGLTEIAARKKFLLFEDRKFGDIGNTVQTQYSGGTHRIANWASLTNAHMFPGPAIITALKSAALSALTASNSSISTEITGGLDTLDIPERGRSPRSLSGGGNAGSGTLSPTDPQSPDALDARRGSVVSVSTTISQSAEYITPPAMGPTSPINQSLPSPTPFSADKAPLARGLLLLAQMSSEDNMLTPAYTAKCVEHAREHRDFVLGFIAQETLNSQADDNFITLTPGISLPPAASTSSPSSPRESPERTRRSPSGTLSGHSVVRPSRPPTSTASSSGSGKSTPASPPPTSQPSAGSSQKQQQQQQQARKGDTLGQQYNTPRHAVLEKGVDVIIVGRGIIGAYDRVAEAERYRKEGWAAYLQRIGVGDSAGRRKAAGAAGKKT
ncbi:MAG: orotidine 5'-phosphate decarboxylase [Alyxoria varia]|nr:MAG: orotidine 5'-phosphate decarboxylase [Alyxoria varia]